MTNSRTLLTSARIPFGGLALPTLAMVSFVSACQSEAASTGTPPVAETSASAPGVGAKDELVPSPKVSAKTGTPKTTYQVTGVKQGDVLNVRAQPDHKSAKVHSYSAEAGGIVRTGKTRTVGQSSWVEVNVPEGTGWVNSKYLREVTRSEVAPPPALSPSEPKAGAPREASSPGSGLDILGARLGMSSASVQEVLRSEDPPFSEGQSTWYRFHTRENKYRPAKEGEKDAFLFSTHFNRKRPGIPREAPGGSKSPTYDNDRVTVFYTPPPSAPSVRMLVRSTYFTHRPTALDSYVEALKRKYGEPQVYVPEANNRRDLVFWSEVSATAKVCSEVMLVGNPVSIATFWRGKGKSADCGASLLSEVHHQKALVSRVELTLGNPKDLAKTEDAHRAHVVESELATNRKKAEQAGTVPDL